VSRPLQPMIVVPVEACGPAMFALTPTQRAFVVAKVHFGCNNAEAARRAGYSKNQPADAKVSGYHLAHNDAVQAAIIEESRKLMAGEGPRSIRTLVAIRDDRSKEAKDRIKAAVELLNRGGLQAVTEHHLTVEHQMTDAQKDQRILALCRELGVPDADARKMLIAPEVLDAEFEEVPEPEKTPEQAERAERYARAGEREKQAARRAMTPEELEAHKAATREAHAAAMKARYAEAQQSREGIEDLFEAEAPDAA